LYKDLDAFEQLTIKEFNPENRSNYIKILNEMERRLLATKAAKYATAECYTLRNNIEFIRESIGRELIYRGRS
jgi:hypothetical protein